MRSKAEVTGLWSSLKAEQAAVAGLDECNSLWSPWRWSEQVRVFIMSKLWGKVEMRGWTACGETTILSHVRHLLGVDLWFTPHRTWQSGIPGAGSACLSVHRICFWGCILLSSWAYSTSVSQVSVFPLSVLKSSDHHHSYPLWLSKSCWNLKVSSRQSPQSMLLGCWPRRWGLTLVMDAVTSHHPHPHPTHTPKSINILPH